MDSFFLRERALNCILSPLCCSLLVWDLAPSLGRWWHKPGPSPSVLLGAVGLGSEGLWEQIARQCGELVPHYCVSPLYLPGLGTAALAYPSLLTCAGSLSHDWSLCQRSCSHKGSWVGGTHTRRKGLTFRGKLSRFVYRGASFLRLMKGRWAKKQRQEQGGGKQSVGGGVSSMRRPHGCVCEGL